MSIQPYKDLITSEHRVQPKFMAWLTSWLTLVNDGVNATASIPGSYDIDTAAGAQLDAIGQTVGRGRVLNFQPTSGLSPVLDDANYRVALKAKIAQNQWDGTIPQIYDIWYGLFTDVGLVVVDNQDMTMSVIVNGQLDPIVAELIASGYIIPKPAGVGLNIISTDTVSDDVYLGLVVTSSDSTTININLPQGGGPMAVYGVVVMTEHGLALYAKAQSGVQLNFSRMQLGSGKLTDQDPTKLTALITPFANFAINSISSMDNTSFVRGTFENSSLIAPTYSCELGLFAQDPDVGEILYAYANAGDDGDTLPPISAGPFSKQYTLNVAIGNATNVTATIPADVYIPVSDKGVAGGVAPMDAFAKVPLANIHMGPGSGLDADMVGGSHASTNADPNSIVKRGPDGEVFASHILDVTSDGEARIHIYNRGDIAEWLVGQKSKTDHAFKITKNVAGNESDFLTIDPFTGQVYLTADNQLAWHDGNNPASLAANGWQKLASGLIVQWGIASVPDGGGNAIFPIAFPTICMGVFVTADMLGTAIASINNKTNTQVSITQSSGATRNIQYLAIGF